MSSGKFKEWRTVISLNTCFKCLNLNGRIFFAGDFEEQIDDEDEITGSKQKAPPLHERCGCYLEDVVSLLAGTATKNGKDGADWWLKYFDELPDYYITEEEAKEAGWVRSEGNLGEVAPGKMLFRGVYKNKKVPKQLPVADGRIWYEADINYTGGYRGNDRILFSSDGLIFVTYDHYRTFYEIY